MIDNRAEVYKILSETTENVDYRHPANLLDDDFPKTCYYTSNMTEIAFEDNYSSMVKIETTIQVYEKNIQGEIVEAHNEILESMKINDFNLIYYDNYFDTEDRTHIHTMRFTKIYDNEKEIDIYE